MGRLDLERGCANRRRASRSDARRGKPAWGGGWRAAGLGRVGSPVTSPKRGETVEERDMVGSLCLIVKGGAVYCGATY